MFIEIRKWLHNKRYNTPMCPCGWKMIPSTRKHFEQYCILSLSLHHMSSPGSNNYLALGEVVGLCLEEFCYHPLATFQTSSSPAHRRKDTNTSLFRCRHLFTCKNLSKCCVYRNAEEVSTNLGRGSLLSLKLLLFHLSRFCLGPCIRFLFDEPEWWIYII